MAALLNLGEGQFLAVKLCIGGFAAFVLYRCAHLKLARRGMRVVLVVYGGLMFVHLFTGFAALGWQAPETVFAFFAGLPHAILAFFS